MGDLLQVVLPVFLVIGFGFLASRMRWFSDAGVNGLMVFTQKFAIPCLLFNAIANLDLHQSFDLRLLASFYVGAVTGFILGFLGARYLFNRPLEDSIAIGFACLFSNSLLLGLPISERAYGADSLAANFTIIAIHSPLCYFIGITSMELVRSRGASPLNMARRVIRAMFSNALIMGLALGFIVNLGGIPLPAVLTEATSLIARAALPAAIFGLGGVLARYRPEGDIPTVLYIMAIGLVVHPIITLGLGTALDVPMETLRNGVITAAMAPGVNAYIFADMYGCARRVNATAVLLSTAASILTVWIWLQVLS